MGELVRDLVIIGSGPAGYTAAIYAARAGLAPLVLTGAPDEDAPDRLPGGQLVTTTVVENFPGFPDGVEGFELMERLAAQAVKHGAQVRAENVRALALSRSPFTLHTDSDEILARAVIIATGASARWLGVDGEAAYRGRGVSACATCDGPLFAGRDVVVVGSGDTALEEAVYLSRIARRVLVLARGDRPRASRHMQERARRQGNLRIEPHVVVDAILGDDQGVTGVRVRDPRGGATSVRPADAVFVAIGHTPATALVAGQLELDASGYVVTQPGTSRTSRAGVFACGDVQDPSYRQAITAAGSGCIAALDAERWLAAQADPREDRRVA